MPDWMVIVTLAARIVVLCWVIDGWLAVALTMRFRGRELAGIEAFGASLGTPLFVGLMGWLD